MIRELVSVVSAIVLTMAGALAADRAHAGKSTAVAAKPATRDMKKNVETAGLPREFSHAGRNFLIRLEYSANMRAEGPVDYAVTILPDRSVTIIGINGHSGSTDCCELVRKKTLSVREYDAVVKQLDATKLSRVNPGNPPPDASTVTMTLVDEPFDFYHVVFTDMACNSAAGTLRTSSRGTAPNSLDQICKLAALIQHVTGADKWGEQTTLH